MHLIQTPRHYTAAADGSMNFDTADNTKSGDRVFNLRIPLQAWQHIRASAHIIASPVFDTLRLHFLESDETAIRSLSTLGARRYVAETKAGNWDISKLITDVLRETGDLAIWSMPSCKFYISGPMTGLPEHGFPAFLAAEEPLAFQGHTFFSPARHSMSSGLDFEYGWYIRKDVINLMEDCEAIYLLPNWEQSTGACLEVANAQVIDIPIFDATTGRVMQKHRFAQYGTVRVKGKA